MCAFHSRAFLVARSIYAARAAMAGRPLPPLSPPPGPVCAELQHLFGTAPAVSGDRGQPPAEAAPVAGSRMAALFAAAPGAAASSGEADAPPAPRAS